METLTVPFQILPVILGSMMIFASLLFGAGIVAEGN